MALNWIIMILLAAINSRMKSSLLRALLLVVCFTAPFAGAVLAQPGGDPPPCWPPPCIPIDGGISALLAAGLFFGGAKAMQMRRVGQKP